MTRIAAALAVLFIAAPLAAQTMYRCGNTFSQQPCEPGAVVKSQPVPAAGRVSAPAGPKSETERLEAIVSDSQRDRRKRDLRDRILPDAEASLVKHRADCEQRQKELAASQYAYKQNLYGKTHAAQMASEMAAAAAKCDTKDRELKDFVDLAAKECCASMSIAPPSLEPYGSHKSHSRHLLPNGSQHAT